MNRDSTFNCDKVNNIINDELAANTTQILAAAVNVQGTEPSPLLATITKNLVAIAEDIGTTD
jgi:hypothetical protein